MYQRVGGYILNKTPDGQYRLTHILFTTMRSAKWLAVGGCTRCLKNTNVVHWLGNTVEIIDESKNPEFAKYVADAWRVQEDFAEKMLAIRTCPRCGTKLEEGEYILYYPVCQVCSKPLSLEDFCFHCGVGMARGLFGGLRQRGLDPIMVA